MGWGVEVRIDMGSQIYVYIYIIYIYRSEGLPSWDSGRWDLDALGKFCRRRRRPRHWRLVHTMAGL